MHLGKGSLDLHGFTLNEALAKTRSFIYESFLAGRKKTIIITGKSGQIAREFPLWLEREDIAPLIKSFAHLPKNLGAWEIKLVKKEA